MDFLDFVTTGFWPASYASDGTPNYTGGSASAGVRPTARADITVMWMGVEPFPGNVTSGTAGVRENIDILFEVPAP